MKFKDNTCFLINHVFTIKGLFDQFCGAHVSYFISFGDDKKHLGVTNMRDSIQPMMRLAFVQK